MKHSHPNESAQGKTWHSTSGSPYDQAVRQKFAPGRSPRIEELISYSEAAVRLGLPTHRLQYAASKGQLLAVPLPNGSTALVKSQLDSWAKARKQAK